MLTGVYYLLSLIGFGVICHWLIHNDKIPPGEPTNGLLRMRLTSASEETKPKATESNMGRSGSSRMERWD